MEASAIRKIDELFHGDANGKFWRFKKFSSNLAGFGQKSKEVG